MEGATLEDIDTQEVLEKTWSRISVSHNRLTNLSHCKQESENKQKQGLSTPNSDKNTTEKDGRSDGSRDPSHYKIPCT